MCFQQFDAGGCGFLQVNVEWNVPARPNGDVLSYCVYQKDPAQLSVTRTVITPDESSFSHRRITLQGLAPYHRSVYFKLVKQLNW